MYKLLRFPWNHPVDSCLHEINLLKVFTFDEFRKNIVDYPPNSKFSLNSKF